MSARCIALLTTLVLGATASAQRVILPNGTGGISPTNEWVVLRTSDLERAERPNDPTQERARTRLLAAIGTLRAEDLLDAHAMFHQPGAQPEQLRLVDAYSQDANVTSAALLAKEETDKLASNVLTTLNTNGALARAIDTRTVDIFAIDGLCMTFEVTREGAATHTLDVYAVPAGKRLQFFEGSYDANDTQARGAIEALLRTFDGATEGDVDSTLQNMILAGLLGAISGIGAALLLRRFRRAPAQS